MSNKSMNFIRKLDRELFLQTRVSNLVASKWLCKKYKISTQYLLITPALAKTEGHGV